MNINSQTQINDTAWAACVAFRGSMTVRQTRDYALVLFFLKYASDCWHDLLQQSSTIADDGHRLDRRMLRARFFLPQINVFDGSGKTIIDSFLADIYGLNIRREQSNIGELIDFVLSELEKRNKVKLDRLFHHVSFNNETILGPKQQRNHRLKQFLSSLAYLDLRTQPGAMNAVFLHLLERFATEEGKAPNTSHTPQQITYLLAALVRPQAGDQIADPVCGDASLLIETARQIVSKNVNAHPNPQTSEQFTLFGQEQDPANWALARMNLYIHGYDGARMELGCALRNPLLLENSALMQFDVVLANPPILPDQWLSGRAEQDPFRRFWRGAPQRSKADYAYISHLIETTRRGSGRMALIGSHGVLFRGAIEGRIRQRLITENLLDAVISLPACLFPNSTIPLVILLFDRSREADGARSHVSDVFLFDVGRFIIGNRHMLTEEQLSQIVNLVETREAQGGYSYLAGREEIVANDYDLNLPRYLYDREQNIHLDLIAELQEIAQLEQTVSELRNQLKQQLEMLCD
jgi:type I restriction enzyme M protein